MFKTIGKLNKFIGQDWKQWEYLQDSWEEEDGDHKEKISHKWKVEIY